VVAASGGRTVWVCRHALSVGNEQHVLQGWGDYPLSEQGRSQALAARRFFSDAQLAQVISSPLRRACETAQLLFGRVDEVDAGWVEQAAPAVEGLAVADAHRRCPQLLDGDGWSLPAAPFSAEVEHLTAVAARAEAAPLRAASAPGSGPVAAVSHGALLASLLAASGVGGRPGNLAALETRVSSSGWELIAVHDMLALA
jgi:broad specificity phosphatase PhoE